ncbi:MAG: 5-formyltetrahydrofolate cyclo-ligase [Actinomycetaceae bacterium]|nr:5-formyltetrahydrofolate cyclo-ligase [Actinomycetaceae bacterium]
MSTFPTKRIARAYFRRLRPAVGLSRSGSAAVKEFVATKFAGSLQQVRVGSFQPLSGELDVRSFNHSFPGPLFFPAYDPQLGMSQEPFFTAAPLALQPFRAMDLVAPQQLILDMILVPALALEPSGVRLGQGGGWYDRALAQLRVANPELLTVGCVPSDFLVPAGTLPAEPHDFRLDFVITELGLVAV